MIGLYPKYPITHNVIPNHSPLCRDAHIYRVFPVFYLFFVSGRGVDNLSGYGQPNHATQYDEDRKSATDEKSLVMIEKAKR